MELEKEKEELENSSSKHSDELKSMQASTEILRNNISEREQKIKLLEASREQDQDLCVKRSTEISEKDTQIKELQLQMKNKSDECENCLEKLKEAVRDIERGKTENEALQKELKGWYIHLHHHRLHFGRLHRCLHVSPFSTQWWLSL